MAPYIFLSTANLFVMLTNRSPGTESKEWKLGGGTYSALQEHYLAGNQTHYLMFNMSLFNELFCNEIIDFSSWFLEKLSPESTRSMRSAS